MNNSSRSVLSDESRFLLMNTFWIHDGKKLTILCSILIMLSVIVIFSTDNTLLAAGFGILLPILGIITVKSAEGWTHVRYWNKKRKEQDIKSQ